MSETWTPPLFRLSLLAGEEERERRLSVIYNANVKTIKSWPLTDGWSVSPDGNRVKLGDWVTSLALNEHFRAAYAAQGPTHRFLKWVTPGRMSPNFDGGTPLHYPTGAVVEAEGAVISDQQCGPGLHVLRPGYRPEWCGLCGADHDLIPLTVEVKSEDILFAGLPTMGVKIRVRRLRVLD